MRKRRGLTNTEKAVLKRKIRFNSLMYDRNFERLRDRIRILKKQAIKKGIFDPDTIVGYINGLNDPKYQELKQREEFLNKRGIELKKKLGILAKEPIECLKCGYNRGNTPPCYNNPFICPITNPNNIYRERAKEEVPMVTGKKTCIDCGKVFIGKAKSNAGFAHIKRCKVCNAKKRAEAHKINNKRTAEKRKEQRRRVKNELQRQNLKNN